MAVCGCGGARDRASAPGLPFLFLLLLASDVAASPAPASIHVPPDLLRDNKQIEASGIVWAPPLERYLVVSDDTGRKGRRHSPWVFAMTRQGVLDRTPIPIRGIDRLNDAEAICAGPDGTYYLATSHSRNKEGESNPARRMLIKLRLAGRELVAEGRLDLTAVGDRTGGGLLEVAGLDPAGALEIEGISASGTALLVGLRSPLTTSGEAVILRVDRVADAFRAGRIPAGSVTMFRSLDLSNRGGTARRGVSDLLDLPDGSLVLLANSPKGGADDGGGALYWLRPGNRTPTVLREFPRLRPEGVTLAEDGRSLMVVFDSGSDLPRWASLPLPR